MNNYRLTFTFCHSLQQPKTEREIWCVFMVSNDPNFSACDCKHRYLFRHCNVLLIWWWTISETCVIWCSLLIISREKHAVNVFITLRYAWFFNKHFQGCIIAVYANYIGPSVMTDANKVWPSCERSPICDDKITENDRCVIKIIGIFCIATTCMYAMKSLLLRSTLTDPVGQV